MIQDIAEYDGQLGKVVGPAASGKTEALIQRCIHLLQAGTDPHKILVGVSSGFAQQCFSERLIAAAPDDLKDQARTVRIERPLDICIEILDTPKARAATGRIPRVLTDAEYKFFLEDVKTCGLSIRRIRKMLYFFYAQWSKLEDEKEWLLAGEESDLHMFIRNLLIGAGSMLRDEAPTVCARYLRSDEGKSESCCFDYVLCDDYQNLSYAEQTCMCLLADKQIMVTGNPNEVTEVNTEYPCSEGFLNFDKLRKGVEVFTLTETFGSKAAIKLGEALCSQDGMDPEIVSEQTEGSDAEVLCIKWNTPDEEINCITRYLASLFSENPKLRHDHVAIVTPNKRWSRLLDRVLHERGIKASLAGSCNGISGDPRDVSRSKALLAYVRLNLLADPKDMVAWRSWCGFGNALCNSDAWTYLLERASKSEQSLYETLEEVAGAQPDIFPRAEILQKDWKSGQSFIEKNTGRKGFALLKAIGAQDLPEFQDVSETMTGEEDAAELFAMVRRSCMDPCYPLDSDLVHITNYENLCGCNYDYIIAVGLVDGFVPNRNAFEVVSTEEERQQVMNDGRRQFYGAVTSAKKMLVLSLFSTSPLEIAEQTKMQVVRIRSEQGERVAQLRPSCFLSEAGNASPSTVGGESIMAELKLNY